MFNAIKFWFNDAQLWKGGLQRASSQEYKKIVTFVFSLQVFFIFAIFVFRENRFFRNLGSFAKLRNSQNSSLIFAKHENRFVASFAKFSRNEISSKTLPRNEWGKAQIGHVLEMSEAKPRLGMS
jgi:hypothetical protein